MKAPTDVVIQQEDRRNIGTDLEPHPASIKRVGNLIKLVLQHVVGVATGTLFPYSRGLGPCFLFELT
jgi:hypothetical protein